MKRYGEMTRFKADDFLYIIYIGKEEALWIKDEVYEMYSWYRREVSK